MSSLRAGRTEKSSTNLVIDSEPETTCSTVREAGCPLSQIHSQHVKMIIHFLTLIPCRVYFLAVIVHRLHGESAHSTGTMVQQQNAKYFLWLSLALFDVLLQSGGQLWTWLL